MSLLITMGLGSDSPVPTDLAVSNVSPADGTSIAKSTPLSMDVTGASSVLVAASFPTHFAPEVVYNGTAFSSPYVDNSRATAITSGFTFYLVRQGGWPGEPTLNFYELGESSA